jgi:hypothetical protein
MFYASSVKQTWTIQTWPGTIPFTVSRAAESLGARSLYYACGVNGFNIPVPCLSKFVFGCCIFATEFDKNKRRAGNRMFLASNGSASSLRH